MALDWVTNISCINVCECLSKIEQMFCVLLHTFLSQLYLVLLCPAHSAHVITRASLRQIVPYVIWQGMGKYKYICLTLSKISVISVTNINKSDRVSCN